MTRTDVMASSRPLTAGRNGNGSSSVARRLTAVFASLVAIAMLGPGAALAAEGTSGYNQEPPKPTTTTTPSTGTSPSKESATPPAKETAPEKTSATPATAKAKTLPFTGLDLRWSFGIGLALMGAGLSIVFVQRHRREGGR